MRQLRLVLSHCYGDALGSGHGGEHWALQEDLVASLRVRLDDYLSPSNPTDEGRVAAYLMNGMGGEDARLASVLLFYDVPTPVALQRALGPRAGVVGKSPMMRLLPTLKEALPHVPLSSLLLWLKAVDREGARRQQARNDS